MNSPIFVDSKITGGHYGLQTTKASKVFQNPMAVNTKIELTHNDIVADIGAYVGEYSIWACRQGARKVLSYEPTPESFVVLQMNKRENMTLINKAVTGIQTDTVKLFISKGIGVTNSIAKQARKAGRITVPAITYEEAVKNATVVKIDVEGAEYGYNIVQPQLRAIILEFHPIVKKPWKQKAKMIMDEIEGFGYQCIKRPQFKHGWDLAGCWAKKDPHGI